MRSRGSRFSNANRFSATAGSAALERAHSIPASNARALPSASCGLRFVNRACMAARIVSAGSPKSSEMTPSVKTFLAPARPEAVFASSSKGTGINLTPGPATDSIIVEGVVSLAS